MARSPGGVRQRAGIGAIRRQVTAARIGWRFVSGLASAGGYPAIGASAGSEPEAYRGLPARPATTASRRLRTVPEASLVLDCVPIIKHSQHLQDDACRSRRPLI